MRDNYLLYNGHGSRIYGNLIRTENFGFFRNGEEYFMSGHSGERKFSFLVFTYRPRFEMYGPRKYGLLSFISGMLKTMLELDAGCVRVVYYSQYECEIGHSIVVRHVEKNLESDIQIFFFGEFCRMPIWNCLDTYPRWHRKYGKNKKQCCACCRSRHDAACCARAEAKEDKARVCSCFTVKKIVLESSSFRANGKFGNRNSVKNGVMIRRESSYDRPSTFELLVL